MPELTIKNLKIPTSIGVYPWEKQVKQTLRFDIEFSSSSQDGLDDNRDYATIIAACRDFLSRDHFELIEQCAQSVATFLKTEFKLEAIALTLTKPNPQPQVDGVSVRVVL